MAAVRSSPPTARSCRRAEVGAPPPDETTCQSASRAGKPPVAIGDQRLGVIRRIDFPLVEHRLPVLAPVRAPEMHRKYSTSGSTESGVSMTSQSPSTCTHASPKSSERTSTLTRGVDGRWPSWPARGRSRSRCARPVHSPGHR